MLGLGRVLAGLLYAFSIFKALYATASYRYECATR